MSNSGKTSVTKPSSNNKRAKLPLPKRCHKQIKLDFDLFVKEIKGIKKRYDSCLGEELLKHITADIGVTSPILVAGEETLRVKRLITWFKDSVIGQDASLQFIHSSAVSNEKALVSLLTSLLNMSIFADYRVVVIFDVDLLKVAMLDVLASYVAKHSSDVVLFLTTKPIGAKKRTASLDDVISCCKTIVNLKSLTPVELKTWARNEFKRTGLSQDIDNDALDLLISLHEDSLDALAQEVSKLSLLAPQDAKITLQMVKQTSWGAKERTSFELLNSMANKDIVKSLKVLSDLLDRGQHPLQLSGFLNKAFRTMLAQASCAGRSYENLHNDIGNAWFVKNLQSAVRLFTIKNIKKSLDDLKQLDGELKNSNFAPEHLIETFITKTTLRL